MASLHGDRIPHVPVRQLLRTWLTFADLTPGQKVIMPFENPKRADGPLYHLERGTLFRMVR